MIITIMTNNTPNSHHTYLLSSLNCNKPIVLFKKCHFSRIELQHQAKWYWKMAICLIRVTQKKKTLNTNKANTGEKDCEKEQRDPKGGRPPRCRHEQGHDDDPGREKSTFKKYSGIFYIFLSLTCSVVNLKYQAENNPDDAEAELSLDMKV